LPGLAELEELPELRALTGILRALVRRAQGLSRECLVAWLHGFAYGDASTLLRSNTLALETPRLDTLLAFLAVATRLADYGRHGLRAAKVYPYIRAASDTKSLQRYKWHAFVRLDPGVYHVVATKEPTIVDSYSSNLETLAAFTAGLIDSDGTIVMSVKRRRKRLYFEPELEIVNTDLALLESLRSAWLRYGISLNLHGHSEAGEAKRLRRLRRVWRLRIGSQRDLRNLLLYIIPFMFNIKRLARAEITKSYIEGEIPRDPALIRAIVAKLDDYYEHTLKKLSIDMIKNLSEKRCILSVMPDGSIKPLQRVTTRSRSRP